MRDLRKAKEVLNRVVKRISIMKRMSIIRQVHEVLEKVVSDESMSERASGSSVSFKKLVKILNLIHIFVPLIQVKGNNSTDLSLDIGDMLELTTSKEKYKKYVLLQMESLELIMKEFRVPININNVFLLITRYMIDKNQFL